MNRTGYYRFIFTAAILFFMFLAIAQNPTKAAEEPSPITVSFAAIEYNNTVFHENNAQIEDINTLTGKVIEEHHGIIPDVKEVFPNLPDSCVFIGWNTRADGTGVNYYPGEQLPFISQPVNLYAIWLS